LSNALKSEISSNTSLDKFISLKVLHKSISSFDVSSDLNVIPAVLSTDKMFLKPKS